MKKVKWLLAGAGDIAKKRVAPAVSGARSSELSAVCDINPDSAGALAKDFNIPAVYTDYSKALAESDSDAVYLALPVSLHVPLAVEALDAGKHVLIEKPLGLTARECAPLLEAEAASGKKAACAYFRRLSPRYLYTKKMLEEGEFGRVVLVRMLYYSWFSPDRKDPKYWRVVKSRSGGGPLSDMGAHMFDVFIGLMGLPASVDARCGNLVNSWDVEDSSAMIMTMPDGAMVTASFNWNSKTWRHEFEVVGTEAKINWLPYDSGPVVKTVGRQVDSLELDGPENVHMPAVEDFVFSILNGSEPACPVKEAVKTNILLDAVYDSSAGKKEVEVVEP